MGSNASTQTSSEFIVICFVSVRLLSCKTTLMFMGARYYGQVTYMTKYMYTFIRKDLLN